MNATTHIAGVINHAAKRMGVAPYLKAVVSRLTEYNRNQFYQHMFLYSASELKLRLKILSAARVIRTDRKISTQPIGSLTSNLITGPKEDLRLCSNDEAFALLEKGIVDIKCSLEEKQLLQRDLDGLRERFSYYEYGCIVFKDPSAWSASPLWVVYLLEKPNE